MKKRNLLSLFLLAALLISSNTGCGLDDKTQDQVARILTHAIRVQLFPQEHTFQASDTMLLESGEQTIILSLNKEFKINSVKVDGQDNPFQFSEIPETERLTELADDNVSTEEKLAGRLTIEVREPGEHMVEVNYEGTVFDEPAASQFSREYIANQTTGIISQQGAFLSPETWWYPQGSEQMSRFEVETITPAGYETVSQGKRLRHEVVSGQLHTHWKNDNPADVLYLQAGPYQIQEDEVDDVKLYTYFFQGGEKLATLYLKKSKQYLIMYNKLLGHYPHSKFAIVENFFETGYGMPSWTLLGKTVVRLPWIPDTSLPHEICHNWWGNGVFVDYARGNWCEGLTVFCADYLLKDKMVPAEGVDYRRQVNRDYASYVRRENDFPLREFKVRHDPATRAVGYGKSMMVFHMLQRKVGKEKFFESLRHLVKEHIYQKATWKDVLNVFEELCEISLDEFYNQWIAQAGAPVLKLVDVEASENKGDFIVTFSIIQEGGPYALEIPVVVTTHGDEFRGNFMIDAPQKKVEIQVQSRPLRLELDPEHELFRRLYPEEIPPSIAKVFGSEKQLIVLPESAEEKIKAEFQKAAEMINKTKTAIIKTEAEINPEELEDVSIIIFGTPAEETAVARLLLKVKKAPPWSEKLAKSDNVGRVVVYNHPTADDQGIMVIESEGKADVLSIARKLPHYGKYSYLLFHGDQNVAKGIWMIESSPLIHVF